MKTTLIRAVLVLTGLAAVLAPTASPATAATSAWTISHTHFSIYFDGGYATLYFTQPQTQLPNNAPITGTSVQVTPYTNGRTTELVQVCYRQQFSDLDYACTAAQAITGATTIPTSLFNGQNARGTITVKHTLTGGTYPATGGTAQDTVTVNYQY